MLDQGVESHLKFGQFFPFGGVLSSFRLEPGPFREKARPKFTFFSVKSEDKINPDKPSAQNFSLASLVPKYFNNANFPFKYIGFLEVLRNFCPLSLYESSAVVSGI